MTPICREIFREYDLRGVVDKELTPEVMRLLGRALAAYFDKNQPGQELLIGRDNRASSPIFRDLLVEELVSAGMNIVDLGEIVSPMFYYAPHHLGIDQGAMITASHNPGEFNGLKVLDGPGTIYGEEIQKLADLAEKLADQPPVKKSGGSVRTYDIAAPYMEMIRSKIKLARPLKVVVDCGNGTASLFAEELFSSLGCDVIPLYCDSDPSFPNHHPDPVEPENLVDLIAEVKKQKADLGIAFDGDGDRIGAVDETGQIIWGDQLMILFWRELLPKYPGSQAIVEVKCSQALPEEIQRLGGKPFFYRTGHSLIKAKMREIGAIFTGEMSGHMFFADEYYGYDDALYAAARLLRLLSQQEKTLSQLLADVPKYHATPELRVDCADRDKFQVVEEITSYFKKKYEVIDVDGARVLFPDGWGLVRASNTSPKLVVRCEAKTPEGLERIKKELSQALSQFPAVGKVQL